MSERKITDAESLVVSRRTISQKATTGTNAYICAYRPP